MSASDAVFVDVPVVPKPRPDPVRFVCAGCQKTVETMPPGWVPRWQADAVPPLCRSCLRHWSGFTQLPLRRVSRADQRALSQLSALINLLNWEIMNGKRRWC